MRKFLHRPSKRLTKHKDQAKMNTDAHNNQNETNDPNGDIETDDASHPPLPPLITHDTNTAPSSSVTDEETPGAVQCHSSDPKEKNSRSSIQRKVNEIRVLKNRIPSLSDSAISLTSNASSDEPIGNHQSDLHLKFDSCSKHPKHEQFQPVATLHVSHLPADFGTSDWVRLIKLKGVDVVRLTVSHTSQNRPDELGFKGVTHARFGTGTAFGHNMDKTEECGCGVGEPHLMSGMIRVITASHCVFNDEEARATTVEFFYDSVDTSTIVKAWGVRVLSVDVERNRSVIECRTHDLDLWRRLELSRREREELIQKLESEVGDAQMAVLISHPHGMCKQVSIGCLKEMKLMGGVKTITDGVQLANCLLTYDTPTCPGSGGGPVNVIGGGTVSYAFAPHCASKGSGENLSGLGWARVP